ncbi:alginate lyase family protein [Nocardia uniformis]|uniref:Alginate lyase family protein n=1 Tax=Nocardia uniformis TaxID=53432 RepID=A0A849CCQ6_9NOCA|nr:alginate lyase family protein [Nocardia uniformis]NNH70811.1 alginate lyase family protein [Nocardia uniformis]
MSGPEILWRSGQLRQRLIARRVTWQSAGDALFGRERPDWDVLLGRFRAGDGPVLLDRTHAKLIAAQHQDAAQAVIEAAERVLAGDVRYFGYPPVCLGSPIDWHYDPLTGTQWPSMDSERIDHRTAASDPKWIWELNRLQHLPWLAQAWLFTGEDRFADAAFEHLDSWIEQQQPGAGIAWRGAFECGIRAVSVAVALQGLRDAPGLTPQRYARILTLLGESARRCWVDRSLFSSANNHLIGEMTGLAVVAILFPELPAAGRWERDALALLTEHGDRQILPDGAGAEQAIAYQLFTVELLLVVYTLLALRGDPPHRMGAVIDRSSRYLALLVGDSDPQPRYGDDDGGFALRLGPEEVRTVREHLGIADAAVPEPTAARAATPSITAAWLRAALGLKSVVSQIPPQSAYAPDGGLVVLRSPGRRVTMDAGPLGYLSIAAHGHADALSVTLAIDGGDVIGDPGTASYYGHPNWRAAHRSTRAHPTVTVDDLDQSVVGGPFLWSEHAEVRVRAVDLDRGVVDAEHNGYRRLSDPVVHRRWLVAPPDGREIVVVDLLSGNGIHSAQASWPLHPRLDVRPVDGGHIVSRAGDTVLAAAYASTVGFEPNQIRGDEQNQIGWWSERLEARTPSWLIGARSSGTAPFVIVTVFGGDATSIRGLRVTLTDADIRVRWMDGETPRALAIDTRLDGAAELGTPDR